VSHPEWYVLTRYAVRTVYINRLRWIILCVAVFPVLAHAAWYARVTVMDNDWIAL
jgi:hypothetical protein